MIEDCCRTVCMRENVHNARTVEENVTQIVCNWEDRKMFTSSSNMVSLSCAPQTQSYASRLMH